MPHQRNAARRHKLADVNDGNILVARFNGQSRHQGVANPGSDKALNRAVVVGPEYNSGTNAARPLALLYGTDSRSVDPRDKRTWWPGSPSVHT